MKILVKKENFSVLNYDLRIEDASLEFMGEQEQFSLLYSHIMDFVITQGRQGKPYFTMLAKGQLYEGAILDEQDIEAFAEALKKKLNGVINIEIRRS